MPGTGSASPRTREASPADHAVHAEQAADVGVACEGVDLPAWLREARPGPTAELDNAYRCAVRVTDARLLELVRLRIAVLLGNPAAVRAPWVSLETLPDAVVARLPGWPHDAVFTERERDCLAFTEQFVMDVAGLSDADAQAMHRHFDPEAFYALVQAIFLMEYAQRLELAAGLLGAGLRSAGLDTDAVVHG